MNKEKMSKEFVFLSEKLSEVARLVVSGDLVEACFILGTLYTICLYHSDCLSKQKEENKNE